MASVSLSNVSDNEGLPDILENTRDTKLFFPNCPEPIMLKVPWVALPGPIEGCIKFRNVLEASSFRDLNNKLSGPNAKLALHRLHRFPSLVFYLSLFCSRDVIPLSHGGAYLAVQGQKIEGNSMMCCLLLEGADVNALYVFPSAACIQLDVPAVVLQYRLQQA